MTHETQQSHVTLTLCGYSVIHTEYYEMHFAGRSSPLHSGMAELFCAAHLAKSRRPSVHFMHKCA